MQENKLPVIMPVKDRLELTKQTVDSLFTNTQVPFYLIIISDASEEPTNAYLRTLSKQAKIIFMPENKGSAACKNAGMSIAGDSEYYYVTDNDMYYLKGWDEILLEIMEKFPTVGVVGGRNHGYHGIIGYKEAGGIRIQLTLQQAGFSMLIRKKAWLDCGPFLHFSPHELGREDVDFCNKVKEAGWDIAQPIEPVVFHCGIKNTFNQNTAGAESELTQKFPPGVIVR